MRCSNTLLDPANYTVRARLFVLARNRDSRELGEKPTPANCAHNTREPDALLPGPSPPCGNMSGGTEWISCRYSCNGHADIINVCTHVQLKSGTPCTTTYEESDSWTLFDCSLAETPVTWGRLAGVLIEGRLALSQPSPTFALLNTCIRVHGLKISISQREDEMS